MTQKTRSLLCMASLVLALGHTTAIADSTYYRWIDAGGKTILSDRPPAVGIEYEVVRAGSRFNSTEVAEETPEDNTVAESSAGADQRAMHEESCALAEQNLATLTSSERITMSNDEGETRFLTKAEVQAEIKLAQDHIDAFCEE